MLNLIRTVLDAFKNEPYQHVLAKIWRRISNPVNRTKIHYADADKKLSSSLLSVMEKQTTAVSISFITPVYNPDPVHLQEMLDSVIAQSSPNWELCIHDDGSSREIIDQLKGVADRDQRIKLTIGNTNEGIVKASNRAILQANGEFLAFLDHDDCIHPDTVYLITKAIKDKSTIKLLYSNEDSINEKGYIQSTTEKLPFGANTLRSVNYINHLTVIKKSVGDQLGWLNEAYEGAQDYDLLLRIIEIVDKNEVHHIPYSLYHWRMAETSISKHAWIKDYVGKSAQNALNEHLKRIGTKLASRPGVKSGTFQLEMRETIYPLVFVRVRIEDSAKLLVKTINNLISQTNYPNYKVVVGNDWDFVRETYSETEISQYFITESRAESEDNVHSICVISAPLDFINKDWLSILVVTHQIKSNDIVAPAILSSNNKVFSEGLFKINGDLTNLYKNRPQKVFTDYFSGISKDVCGVYNICYLCAREGNLSYSSIVVDPRSEVKLLVKTDGNFGTINAPI